MRTLFVSALVLAALTFLAPSAEACERCQQYFYYGCSCWCWTCTPMYCGQFDCEIVQRFGVDFCTGEDGCFESGRGCSEEPPIGAVEPRLEDTWRLAEVRILEHDPKPAAQPAG